MLQPGDKTKIILIKAKEGVGTRPSRKNVSRAIAKDYIRRRPWGKHAYVRPTNPLLTEKNIEGKKSFCKRLIDESSTIETKETRVRILFTDESTI